MSIWGSTGCVMCWRRCATFYKKKTKQRHDKVFPTVSPVSDCDFAPPSFGIACLWMQWASAINCSSQSSEKVHNPVKRASENHFTAREFLSLKFTLRCGGKNKSASMRVAAWWTWDVYALEWNFELQLADVCPGILISIFAVRTDSKNKCQSVFTTNTGRDSSPSWCLA